MSITPNTPIVNVYGCGGAGVDLLKKLLMTDLSQVAKVNPIFVDTSSSNFREKVDLGEIDPKQCFFTEGTDGSGALRDENYEVIDRAVPSILLAHKPAELNILIFSAGGGSGSVIGPKLAAEIATLGKVSIIFMPGSHENHKTCTNSINTWKTMQGVAKSAGFAPVICYDSNGDGSREADVDEGMLCGITAVLDLFSGKHHRLDTKDVLHWAKVDRSVGITPQVVLLDITTSNEDALNIQYPISVASLYSDKNAENKNIPADYSREGYRTTRGTSLYFVIHTGGIDSIIKELTDVRDDFVNRRSSRERSQTSVLDASNNKSDGFVL